LTLKPNIAQHSCRPKPAPLAYERGLGVLAMQPFCGGLVEDGQAAFAFLRVYPEVIPLAGCDSPERVDEEVDLYERPMELTLEDQAAMERYRSELGDLFCRRFEYCQLCPQGVMVTPAMLYGIVAHRMGGAKAAAFAEKAMESVRLCEDCGECAGRCPYQLPIPETLKKHLALYEHCSFTMPEF